MLLIENSRYIRVPALLQAGSLESERRNTRRMVEHFKFMTHRKVLCSTYYQRR